MSTLSLVQKQLEFERRDALDTLYSAKRLSRAVAIYGGIAYSLDLCYEGKYSLEREFNGIGTFLTRDGSFVLYSELKKVTKSLIPIRMSAHDMLKTLEKLELYKGLSHNLELVEEPVTITIDEFPYKETLTREFLGFKDDI